MNVNRILKVQHGDPLSALRQFLAAWWVQNKLDAMLAPVELLESSSITPQVIEDPAGLAAVNPFAPLMTSNAAGIANRFVQDNSDQRLAILLRPCELRAFVELQKRRPVASQPNEVVILGVDCIGTFTHSDYLRSVETHGLSGVTADVLRNAAEGGLRPQRFRTACMVCDWPAPCGADVTIGAIGVPSIEFLLVIARDEATDERLGLNALTGALATEYQVSHRETVVGAVADMRAGMRRGLIEEMQTAYRFNDLGSFLAWFASCSLCGQCLDACPMYHGQFDNLLGKRETQQSGRAALAELVLISRWIASCSGCGMCEEQCENRVPLTLLISALSHRVRSEMHYKCGDPAQRPPWFRH